MVLCAVGNDLIYLPSKISNSSYCFSLRKYSTVMEMLYSGLHFHQPRADLNWDSCQGSSDSEDCTCGIRQKLIRWAVIWRKKEKYQVCGMKVEQMPTQWLVPDVEDNHWKASRHLSTSSKIPTALIKLLRGVSWSLILQVSAAALLRLRLGQVGWNTCYLTCGDDGHTYRQQ